MNLWRMMVVKAKQSIDEYKPDYKNFLDKDAIDRLSNYYKERD